MTWRPRNLTITQRLLALTALAMLPAAAVVVFYIVSLHQQRERELHALAQQYGQLASLEMARILSGADGVLQALSRSERVRSLDPAGCGPYLAEIHEALPQFLGLAAADAAGRVRCASTPFPAPMSIADRPYFAMVSETGRFTVGELTSAKSGEARFLPLALPIFGPGGERAGVVVAALDLDWLGKRLRERHLIEGSSLTIADRNGVIIAREPLPESFVGTRIPDPFLHLVQSDRPGSVMVESQDGTRRVLGYYPPRYSGTGLYVSYGLSTEAAFSAVTQSTYRSVAIALAGAAAVFFIAWIVGERLFRRPIRRLLETIFAWRQGQDSARTGITADGSELSVLANAIDQYMDELVADRAARRRAEEHRTLLVRELDHRVKNILATVQAVAAQSFRGARAEPGLKTFSGRLAAMADTHAMLMSDHWASAELRRTVQVAVKPFESTQHPRITMQGAPLVIHARAALALSMAVHELCTNAIKYGALSSDEGRVSIDWSLSPGPEGDIFTLLWAERGGPPVEPPKRAGFGSRMIERALASELSAKVDLDFQPAGLVCRMECAASSILAEDADARITKAA
ncbi:HWE histidine kinase domain-containing protein [Chelativorans sp.]|uniref:sensor histidine kinase n=1 Tax=Chelativorans sp. TaxID=2203393 RepID=UPI002812033F|nr:HWE histidine kinase domain-containing protein [Chelativorans sp.]